MVINILPFQAQRGNADRQPVRPSHAAAVSRVHIEEDTKAKFGLKGAVTHDGEIPHFAANLKRSGFHLCTERHYAEHLLMGLIGTGIEMESDPLNSEERPDFDPEGVQVKFEGLNRSVLKGQCCPQGFGIVWIGRVSLRCLPVGYSGIYRHAGEELRATGSDVNISVKINGFTEYDLKIPYTNPDVIEFKDAADLDFSGGICLRRLTHSRAGRIGFLQAAVAELRLSQFETVLPNDQTGYFLTTDGNGSNATGDIEGRKHKGCTVNRNQLL